VSPGEDEDFVDAESEPEPDDELRVYTHQEEPEAELELDARPAQKRQQSSSKSFVTASSFPIPNVDDDDDDKEGESEADTPGIVGGEGTGAVPVPRNTRNQEQDEASSLQVRTDLEEEGSRALGKRPVSTAESTNGALASTRGEPSVDAVSTTSLLRNADRDKAPSDTVPKAPSKGILARVKGKSESGPASETDIRVESTGLAGEGNGGEDEAEPQSPNTRNRIESTLARRKSNLRNLVKFDIPEDSKRASVHLRAKQAQMTVQRASSKLKRRKIKDGLVVKMERMLVRVDMAGREVPDDFDENGSQKIDSRVKDKWREYMIVCRHSSSEDAEFVLQMYKTRVSQSIWI